MRVVAVALSLLLLVLAGCVSQPDTPRNGPDDPTEPADAKRMSPPYPAANAQLAAHPAYGWPTLDGVVRGLDAYGVDAWRPLDYRPLPDPIAGLRHLGHAEGLNAGAGIAVYGHYAIVPANGQPGAVVDLSDPAAPKKVAGFEQGTRDADFLVYPDGRIVVVMATSGAQVPILDVTDPENPALLSMITMPRGTHNIAVVPGTPILYNSNSDGGGTNPSEPAGGTEIYDLNDPENPTLVQDWANGYGCHDITFHIDPTADKYRAYCAGIEATQIWDIADPVDPQVVVTVPVHHGDPDLPSASVPLVFFSHLAMVNHDASLLIVGDETGGGLLAACDAYVHQDDVTASGPFGNLYFYDIENEEEPELLSFFSPPSHLIQFPDGASPTAGCTAHFGRLVEDRPLLLMSFYGAGVLLVDFSDPAAPFIADQWNPGTNTWDVWYYQGYAVTGDLERGLDVLTFE